MIHFSFYVPVSHAEKVKAAVFAAGAGKIGNYEHCSFEIKGMGQFRPLKGSTPFLGQEGVIEMVEELKIEMVVEDSLIKQVVLALKAAHPYETPAYCATEMLNY